MKEIRYLPVVLLLLQPVVGSAHNPGHPSPSETTATVVIDASSAEENSSIPRPHAPNAASNPNVPKCHWDKLDAEGRASVWPTLSARHRDYHWRLMTSEERAELRSFLPKMERRRLRERFVTNHQHARDNDRPYVLYKRLSKQELCELREQVRQANKQLVLSKMLKTPAQIESRGLGDVYKRQRFRSPLWKVWRLPIKRSRLPPKRVLLPAFLLSHRPTKILCTIGVLYGKRITLS